MFKSFVLRLSSFQPLGGVENAFVANNVYEAHKSALHGIITVVFECPLS